jgi:hypothetical protein
MSMSRRLLYASGTWEIVRPRIALTTGHILIRLTNPAIAFDLRSATDWLQCYTAARQALAEVLGATHCTVVFAHQWHPIGAAIGEPEAESSTPTFHLFGRWVGEPVTPGEQLLLPVQRRVPAPADQVEKYDDGLRAALRRSAGERADLAPLEDGPLPDIVAVPPVAKAGPHHTVLSPAAEGGALAPRHLLALAASLQDLTGRRGVTGMSCVVPDPGEGLLEIHAMGRSAGESVNPLQEFLTLPEVSRALL